MGIGAGIYLSEFGGSKLNTVMRFATDVLSGVPSITIGVFVYALVVQPMRHLLRPGRGAWPWRWSWCR